MTMPARNVSHLSTTQTPRLDSAFGFAYGFILVLGMWLATLFVSCSPPAKLKIAAGFGATASRCELAYGSPKVISGNFKVKYPNSHSYVTSGWTIFVGSDEQDRAEQFVILKSGQPPPALSTGEQNALLDQFKEGSTWNVHSDNGNGPIWVRADEQAYASYIADRHWMVLMNAAGMQRSIKAHNRNAGQL